MRRHTAVRRGRAMEVNVGAFEVRRRGIARFDWRDPYHGALTVRWTLFLTGLFCLYLAINLVFAVLYLVRPGSIANAAAGSYADAFFFSIETLATVGYGAMSPATLYGHVISTIEIFCGLAFTALATGMTFVRFSRPRGKFLFADNAVIGPMNGRPTLMIRVAQGRKEPLADARATLSALIAEQTQEGVSFRRNYDLPLVRAHFPLFVLTWTVMHELDESSPLYGMDARALAARDVRLLLSVSARDPALATDVHAYQDYPAEKLLFGMRYVDAMVADERGRTLMDLTLLSEVEAVPEF